ncbi:unnamed protein product [Linum tenue]|uniref:Uncharacterized protein n=1 Tax=Linum tenue TaxID=586396 RepID=A0AAV0KNM9_9ROSI|nr:unnamed protein product [Linum tenue]
MLPLFLSNLGQQRSAVVEVTIEWRWGKFRNELASELEEKRYVLRLSQAAKATTSQQETAIDYSPWPHSRSDHHRQIPVREYIDDTGAQRIGVPLLPNQFPEYHPSHLNQKGVEPSCPRERVNRERTRDSNICEL